MAGSRLGTLADRYFTTTKGARLAYVTDTAWSEASRPVLLKLAHRARRLYCDSYYAAAQLRQAETYRHMTAIQAADLAVAARVEELVLIHFAPRYRGRYQELIEEARAIFPRTSAELSDPGHLRPDPLIGPAIRGETHRRFRRRS